MKTTPAIPCLTRLHILRDGTEAFRATFAPPSTEQYIITAKAVAGDSDEPVGYCACIASQRLYPDREVAIRAALGAIEHLPVNPNEF